jgi:hypothetical protein
MQTVIQHKNRAEIVEPGRCLAPGFWLFSLILALAAVSGGCSTSPATAPEVLPGATAARSHQVPSLSIADLSAKLAGRWLHISARTDLPAGTVVQVFVNADADQFNGYSGFDFLTSDGQGWGEGVWVDVRRTRAEPGDVPHPTQGWGGVVGRALVVQRGHHLSVMFPASIGPVQVGGDVWTYAFNDDRETLARCVIR